MVIGIGISGVIGFIGFAACAGLASVYRAYRVYSFRRYRAYRVYRAHIGQMVLTGGTYTVLVLGLLESENVFVGFALVCLCRDSTEDVQCFRLLCYHEGTLKGAPCSAVQEPSNAAANSMHAPQLFCFWLGTPGTGALNLNTLNPSLGFRVSGVAFHTWAMIGSRVWLSPKP